MVEALLETEHPGEGTAAPARARAPARDELVALPARVVLVAVVRGFEQAPTTTATTKMAIVQRDAREVLPHRAKHTTPWRGVSKSPVTSGFQDAPVDERMLGTPSGGCAVVRGGDLGDRCADAPTGRGQ